jgi:hypothetical protein
MTLTELETFRMQLTPAPFNRPLFRHPGADGLLLTDAREDLVRKSGLDHARYRVGPRRIVMAAVLVLSAAMPASSTPDAIDTGRSTITIHVFKAGLFRVLADDHEIQAPIKEGSIDEGTSPAVKLVVEAERMHVLDPGLSPKDRNEVQTRMLGVEVLDASHFTKIGFESTAVDRLDSGGWLVRGHLTLHGQRRPVVVKVAGEHGHYTGFTSLKQTDFGITPISIAGGTVKVKDEVRVEFDVWTPAPKRDGR